MDALTTVALVVGVIVVLGFVLRKLKAPPPAPDEALRELLGPRGMAKLERNQAAQDAMRATPAARAKETPGTHQVGILFDIDDLGGGFYGHASYKILFGALDTNQLIGCSLRDGDTNETLAGRSRRCCISVESNDASAIDGVRKALSRATAQGLLPLSERFLEDALVRKEPLVFAGRVSIMGDLTDCQTDWVKQAWDSSRSARG